MSRELYSGNILTKDKDQVIQQINNQSINS